MRRGDGNLREQMARYLEAAERFQLIVRRVREVLEDYDIPQSLGQHYRNFASRVLKITGRFELLTRHVMVVEAVRDAVAYGCNQGILERISREVTGYDIEERGRELKCGE